MKNPLKFTILVISLTAAVSPGQSEPLANEGKLGLYARSIEQVLRLEPEQVDLAAAALIISERWSKNVNGRRYLQRLDDMALEIRNRLRAKRVPPNRAIVVINEYLFEELGFKSVKEATNPNDLFLHTVLDKRRGYCLSLSILYLSLAERLNLPIYGVVVPGHFFVRYDDGREAFNIETTSKGGTAPDKHYITKFKVPMDYPESIYMVNLDKVQTLGCLLNNLGNTYSNIGDAEAALVALETAVQINPTLGESHMNLGNIYLKKGWVTDAIHEYHTALEINPSEAKTYFNLGNAYAKQERLNNAVTEYLQSLELDPNCTDTYKALAMAYSRQDMFGQAILRLRQAMMLKPKDSTLYSQLGEVYSQKGDYQQAISQYKKALGIKPKSADAHYGLGTCYNQLGLIDEEIQAYRNALAVEPDMLAALMNLGNAYFTREDYNSAILQYNKAALLKPDESTVFYNLGAAYSNKGDYEKAVVEYAKAIRIDPEMANAHNGLAYGFYMLNDYESAWKHIKLAEQLGADIDKKLLKAIEANLPKE
jgi:tetratricopeptide (TPR) repeat protein